MRHFAGMDHSCLTGLYPNINNTMAKDARKS
jgi:hypothetical protein